MDDLLNIDEGDFVFSVIDGMSGGVDAVWLLEKFTSHFEDAIAANDEDTIYVKTTLEEMARKEDELDARYTISVG